MTKINEKERLVKVETKNGKFDWVKAGLVSFWMAKGYIVGLAQEEGRR